MMDKKPHIKPYLYGMFAGFGAISLSILFFFLIYRFDGFGNADFDPDRHPDALYLRQSSLPICSSRCATPSRAFLHQLRSRKRCTALANMLAIALTILFGLLLIYALMHDDHCRSSSPA